MVLKESKNINSNYQNKNKYIRESYSKKKDYVATSFYIEIDETSNKIVLNKIED